MSNLKNPNDFEVGELLFCGDGEDAQIEFIIALDDNGKKYWKQLPKQQPFQLCKWISVEERLPEDDGHKLVFGISHREYAIHVGFYNGSSWYHFPQDEQCSRLFDVTHWMPLPENPT